MPMAGDAQSAESWRPLSAHNWRYSSMPESRCIAAATEMRHSREMPSTQAGRLLLTWIAHDWLRGRR